MNAASSRSHAVFTLLLRRRGGGPDARVAKFRLVDLAGSERNKRSGANGARFEVRTALPPLHQGRTVCNITRIHMDLASRALAKP